VSEFTVAKMIADACTSQFSPEVIAAYDALYPDESYKEGPSQLPLLVPTSPDNPATEANRAAWTMLQTMTRPFLTAFSDKDLIKAGGDAIFQKLIPGCTGQAHTIIIDGGHFLQEDQSERLVEVMLNFMAVT
jgi:haloalkane dehalogenase